MTPERPGHPVAIDLREISKRFGAHAVVDRVSLHIEPGLLYVLLGPSGCGKTTTLRMIAGLEELTSGSIHIGPDDMSGLPPYRRGLGFVFQSYALFPHMSVEQNIAFGLRMQGVDTPSIRKRVAEGLALVQLTGLGDRRARQLSGGQQQRVALARALVTRPRALLLDEPLSNLDKNLRDEMRGQIRDVQRNVGITTVMVTHDQEEALSMADRIVVMRDGRLEQVGTPEEVYRRPASAFVARFIGTANILAGRLVDRHVFTSDSGLTVPAPASTSPGARGHLVIRPADVRLSPATDDRPQLRGRIESIQYLGSICRASIRLDEANLFTVDVPANRMAALPRDGSLVVSWSEGDSHFLSDENGGRSP